MCALLLLHRCENRGRELLPLMEIWWLMSGVARPRPGVLKSDRPLHLPWMSESDSVVSNSCDRPHGLYCTWTELYRLPCPWDSSGKRSGLPFPSSGDLPDPGIEPSSPALQADSLRTELWGKPRFASQNGFDCGYVETSHLPWGVKNHSDA